MTKLEITEVVINEIEKGYFHFIIYYDYFYDTYNWKYVKEQEDIEKLKGIKSLGSPSMFTIEVVYNYYLDIDGKLR